MFCSGCGAEVNANTRFCQKCGLPVSAAAPAAYAAQPGTTGPVYTGTAVRIGPRYAGFWLRVAAYLVDGIIVSVPLGIVIVCGFVFMGGAAAFTAHITQLQNNPDQVAANLPAFITAILGFYALFFLFALVIGWLYSALMESSAKQGTVGKIILNLYVTDMNGNRLSFGRASGRYFGKFVTGLIPFAIGYIMAGFTEKKQALHDFIAATLVYRKD